MSLSCPECRQSSSIGELEGTPESTWLTCRACGHVWRGPGIDAFPYIVCNRAASARPVADRRPGRPRAPRFEVNLPMRYRTGDTAIWQAAVTENISRSGVLFRSPQPLQPRTAVELELEVPNPIRGGPAGRVTCLGDVVRAEHRNGGSPTHAVAVAVGTYRLMSA